MASVIIVSSIPPRKQQRPDWADLAEYTIATQRKYAAKWGYDYHLDVSDLRERPCGTKRGDTVGEPVSIYYKIKFILLEHFLRPEQCGKAYEWAVWFDSDCLVTNYDVPLESFLTNDIVLPYDVNGLHPTIIMVRRTPLTVGYLWMNKEAGMRYYLTDYWSDNWSQRMALATPPYSGLVDYYSAQKLCAMPPGIYPIPEETRELYEWDESSLTLHLSALTIEQRIAIAKEYTERLGLL